MSANLANLVNTMKAVKIPVKMKTEASPRPWGAWRRWALCRCSRRASPWTPRRAPSKWKLPRTQVDINNLPRFPSDHQIIIEPQWLTIRWEIASFQSSLWGRHKNVNAGKCPGILPHCSVWGRSTASPFSPPPPGWYPSTSITKTFVLLQGSVLSHLNEDILSLMKIFPHDDLPPY